MDKNLELRLVERGYIVPPRSLKGAGEAIESVVLEAKGLGDNFNNQTTDLVLFEGIKEAIFMSEHLSTIKGPVVAIFGTNSIRGDYGIDVKPLVTSLQVYSLQDLMENKIDEPGSARIGIKDGSFVEVKTHNLGLTAEVNSRKNVLGFTKLNKYAAIAIIQKKEGSNVLYFQRADRKEEDDNFWRYITREVGLPVTKDSYGYIAEHEGIKLRMGGYTIAVTFPKKKSKKFLDELTHGLKVVPVEVDGIQCVKKGSPYIPLGGKNLNVRIDGEYKGKDLMAYLSRVLQTKA